MSNAPRALFLMLPLAAAILLAGCTDGAEEKAVDVDRPEAEFDASTGGIVGLVLDENQLPIAGASVGLDVGSPDEQTAETPATGVFTFSRVPPGEHTVMATALGYQTGRASVTVVAGQLAENVQVTLVQGPSTEPYHLTETHRRTISAIDAKPLPQCYYAAEYAPVPPPFGTLKTCFGTTTGGCDDATPCVWNWTDMFEANPNWRTILHEGMWTGSSAATGRSFSIDLATPSYRSGSYNYNDKEVFVDEGNDPPLVIRVDFPDTLIEREIDLEHEYCCGWHTRLFGASCTMGYCYAGFGPDYGILIDQSIELYFSFGFNAQLPPEFTALPEDA